MLEQCELAARVWLCCGEVGRGCGGRRRWIPEQLLLQIKRESHIKKYVRLTTKAKLRPIHFVRRKSNWYTPKTITKSLITEDFKLLGRAHTTLWRGANMELIAFRTPPYCSKLFRAQLFNISHDQFIKLRIWDQLNYKTYENNWKRTFICLLSYTS